MRPTAMQIPTSMPAKHNIIKIAITRN